MPREAFECLIRGQKRQPRYSWAQSPLGTPCLYTWLLNPQPACGIHILAGAGNGLEHAAEQNPSPHRQQCSAQVSDLSSLLIKGFSCLVVLFQCWLILNLSSLVNFKIKYRDLLSHCLRVSSKNSPFSLVAGSVLGHFYNWFSSSVSKLTRLSCFYHSCLRGCSRSLLLWELQAFCSKNVSSVLNSLTASLYMFVLVPELSLQLKSFSLPMPQLCRCFSSRHPDYSAYHKGPALCQESWALSSKVISNKATCALWILCLQLKITSAPSAPWEFSSQQLSFLSKNPPCGNSQTLVSLCVAKRILR